MKESERFLGDGLVQLLTKLDQFRLRLLVLRQATRHFAGMFQLAVDVLEQGGQLFAKLRIIVRTTEPAGIAEFNKQSPRNKTGSVQNKSVIRTVWAGRYRSRF